jgi:hypothetical protein
MDAGNEDLNHPETLRVYLQIISTAMATVFTGKSTEYISVVSGVLY